MSKCLGDLDLVAGVVVDAVMGEDVALVMGEGGDLD